MRHKTDLLRIIKKLEGLQTIDTIMKILNIKRQTAINYISQLRKKGYVEYYSAGRSKRIYKISIIKSKFKENNGVYNIINKYSKIKVAEPYAYFIHNKKLTNEEALVLALRSQNFKLILASLNLFAHIKDWKLLNKIAKKYKLQRQVGALYELARQFIRTKRMDERIKKSMQKGKGEKYIYAKIKTKDFNAIAKKWRVEIPFRNSDLMRLKTG